MPLLRPGSSTEGGPNLPAAGQGYSFDYYSMFSGVSNPSVFFPPACVFNVQRPWKLFPNVLGFALENVLLSPGGRGPRLRRAGDARWSPGGPRRGACSAPRGATIRPGATPG